MSNTFLFSLEMPSSDLQDPHWHRIGTRGHHPQKDDFSRHTPMAASSNTVVQFGGTAGGGSVMHTLAV